MKIYSALQIGEYHLNHCEDYLFIGSPGTGKILCAVMDGCTMGTDSYFISTLVGKLLRKICKRKSYEEFYLHNSSDESAESYLRSIVRELFSELNVARSQLLLERDELLTTLIILFFDEKINEGIVLVIGDGLVNINGEIIDFDQDNKPDYIGFHLDEPFDPWYDGLNQKLYFNSIQDISIATDGITLFAKTGQGFEDIDPVHFLTADKEQSESDDMLYLKLKKLEHVYGLEPGDDLAMIRLIAD
ncbi:protein phosphatase 2C domain-containing protein [Chitinophagaceae bacterium MMS25-I14]